MDPRGRSSTDSAAVKAWNNEEFWLLTIGAGLIAIHLTLTWKINDYLLCNSILFWLAVASSVWEKRPTLRLASGVVSSCFGILIITVVLLNSASITKNDLHFLQFSPLLSAFGLALLASGFKGLRQYTQELLMLLFLGVPYLLLSRLVDLSPLTAKFAALILWYSGFSLSQTGTSIQMRGGGVEVYPGCSGIESMSYLLGLSVVVLIMFPLGRVKQILLPLVAAVLAFVVNGVRVAFLAVLVASSNETAFDYWHEGQGSLLFSLFTAALFGGFCLLLLQSSPNQQQRT